MTIEQARNTVKNGAVFVDRSNLGMLKLTGGTRVDLIHRMSTQDLRNMQTGEGRATVLTTDIGRIIDRVIVYAATDKAYLLTGENVGDPIARYLMRYVFFNDDFQLEDLTSQTAIFGVYGAQASERLAQVGFPETDLPLHHWREVTIDGVTLYLHSADSIAGGGYFVMCHMSEQAQIAEKLAAVGILSVDEPTFDYLRIEAGLPRFGRELTEDFIPLETGLWDDVSFSKGCYIGQEIIARMDSRGRLAKKMVRFSAESPLELGEIRSNGKKAGTLTSVANSEGGSVALGYVRTKVLESAEATLTINNTELHIQSDG